MDSEDANVDPSAVLETEDAKPAAAVAPAASTSVASDTIVLETEDAKPAAVVAPPATTSGTIVVETEDAKPAATVATKEGGDEEEEQTLGTSAATKEGTGGDKAGGDTGRGYDSMFDNENEYIIVDKAEIPKVVMYKGRKNVRTEPSKAYNDVHDDDDKVKSQFEIPGDKVALYIPRKNGTVEPCSKCKDRLKGITTTGKYTYCHGHND